MFAVGIPSLSFTIWMAVLGYLLVLVATPPIVSVLTDKQTKKTTIALLALAVLSIGLVIDVGVTALIYHAMWIDYTRGLK